MGVMLACGLAITIASFVLIVESCETTISPGNFRLHGYPACFEFWANRYQTLLVGAFAIVLGLLACRPLGALLTELRLQSAELAYENARTRYFEAVDSLSFTTELIPRCRSACETAESLMGGSLSDGDLRRRSFDLSAACRQLVPLIDVMPVKLGRAWSSTAVLKANREMQGEINELASLVSSLSRLLNQSLETRGVAVDIDAILDELNLDERRLDFHWTNVLAHGQMMLRYFRDERDRLEGRLFELRAKVTT